MNAASTFTASCTPSLISSPHSLSLYSRLWIRCSAGPPVISEKSGRSSSASSDNQLMSSRGWSWALAKHFWIKVRIRLRKGNAPIQRNWALKLGGCCWAGRIAHRLLSGWSWMFFLNRRNWTFSIPDQFSSSTAGPSRAASAPGCLRRRSRGMSRTTSDTRFCAQWLISPKTTLMRRQRKQATMHISNPLEHLFNLKLRLTTVHLGIKRTIPPGFCCPLRPQRTVGDTAQPSLSLPG